MLQSDEKKKWEVSPRSGQPLLEPPPVVTASPGPSLAKTEEVKPETLKVSRHKGSWGLGPREQPQEDGISSLTRYAFLVLSSLILSLSFHLGTLYLPKDGKRETSRDRKT